MLRLILNSHSRISVPPECGFSMWLSSKYSCIDIYDMDLYERYASDVVITKKFETWNVSKNNIISVLKKEEPKSYQEMVECVYLSYSINNNKKSLFFGDKNNYYMNELESLNSVFPESKYVALIRDGRDVAASYKALSEKQITLQYSPKLSTDIALIAEEWVSGIRKLNNLRKVNENLIFIKYEDILSNP